MAESRGAGSLAEPWLWAGGALLRNLPLAAAAVALGALAYAWDNERAQAYLWLAAPLLVLHGLLEMRFFVGALARRGEAPKKTWSRRRLLGFGVRWIVLLVLFAAAPLALVSAAMLFGGEPYPERFAGRILSVVGAGGWWLGYALMGSVLPAYLSRRPSGLGDAVRRGGLARRLRAMAAPALLYLAASLGSNEMTAVAGAPSGATSGSLPLDAAVISVVADIVLLLATALAARALTDDLIDNEGLGTEAVKVFE